MMLALAARTGGFVRFLRGRQHSGERLCDRRRPGGRRAGDGSGPDDAAARAAGDLTEPRPRTKPPSARRSPRRTAEGAPVHRAGACHPDGAAGTRSDRSVRACRSDKWDDFVSTAGHSAGCRERSCPRAARRGRDRRRRRRRWERNRAGRRRAREVRTRTAGGPLRIPPQLQRRPDLDDRTRGKGTRGTVHSRTG